MSQATNSDMSNLQGAPQALRLMASRHGHHLTLREATQAWSDVKASNPVERLRAAWRWLYPEGDVVEVPWSQRHQAQFPAWVMDAGRLGVVLEMPSDDGVWSVSWEGAEPQAWNGQADRLWVAVMPTRTSEPLPVDAAPATSAIKTALREHAPVYRRVALATVIINVLAIVTSLYAMQVYDRVVPNFALATLWVLSSGVVLMVVFDIVFKVVKHKLLESVAYRLDEALSLYFFEKVMALKLDRRPQRVGSLVAQVRDYESVKAFFTSSTLFALADLPFVFFYILVIALISGPVSLVPLAFLPICVGIGFAVMRPLARLQKEQTDESTRRSGALYEAIQGAETLKAQGGEWHFSALWQSMTRQINVWSRQIQDLTAWSQFAAGSLQQLAYVAVIIVGVYQIQAGNLTMGGLIATSILAGRVLSSISQITPLFVRWQHARHALETLDKILALPSDESTERTASAQANPRHLAVDNVLYMYEGQVQPQLQVMNLRIEQGARIAVLGRNGSGKSTLLRLLAGLATPNSGQVSLADLDLQTARQGWIRDNIGYLPQEVRLFAGTLRDNLLMGLSMPDEAHLRAVMARTGLDRMVASHPQGLDWPVREGGHGLSGGQRQLIGFTRLALQNPAIWLLDEPSASLDQETEASVMAYLQELPADRTLVFTTHKAGWMKLARRVLAIEGGKIAADVPADRARAATREEAEALKARQPVAAPPPSPPTESTSTEVQS